MRLLTLAFGTWLLVGAGQARADTTITCRDEPRIHSCVIHLTGRIGENDFFALYERFESIEGEVGATLWLDSEGGDLEVAIRIGRLLSDYGRFKYVHTLIAAGASCFSACPMVYAAGHIRQNQGALGLHRPFPTDKKTGYLGLDEFAMAAWQEKAKVQEYLELFGVSPCLMEAAMVVASDRIWVLSAAEQQRYGLGPENVAIREFQKARAIARCGSARYALGRLWEQTVLERCALDDDHHCVVGISAEMRQASAFDYAVFVNDCLR